jgi:hypothetical protein
MASDDWEPPDWIENPFADASGRDVYSEMVEDYGIDDPHFWLRREELYDGWFNEELSPEERAAAREHFFDLMDWDTWEFDWDAWRDYMGYGEAA